MEEFSSVCDSLRNASGHKERSQLIYNFIRDPDKGVLKSNANLLLRMLLPKETKRVYGLKDKQLINLFHQLLEIDRDELTKDLESAEDVASTIGHFFDSAESCVSPASKSSLSLEQVDDFLETLSNTSKESNRLRLFKSIVKKCTVPDLISLIRLITQDLRTNAGCKQVLDGLHPQAYAAYQASGDLNSVLHKVMCPSSLSENAAPKCRSKKHDQSRRISTGIRINIPIKPMLAEPCRSAAQALSKSCTDGWLLAEIKYDGERIQIHKDGDQYHYFSRSLRPVPANRVSHVEPYIPDAFKLTKQLVIDCEILLLDTKTGKPLPFSSLGVHKRTKFEDASVCIFVFDCLYLNGQSLIDKPISLRRATLEQYFCEVPNRVRLSEKHIIHDVDALNELMARVFSENLEGLVLKPSHSVYEPGKRHWLKIKRDYLAEGSMADAVDLIVLGAYYGTGKKAGLMSVFLMGAYDPESKLFTTVTKCGNGFTDELLRKLQESLKMKKISKSEVPDWLLVSKSLVPDFIVEDPKTAPVWEITGAEFSRANTHTAGSSGDETQGISIRFPRFAKVREDKSWKEATNVKELFQLSEKTGSRSDWLDALQIASRGIAGKRPDPFLIETEKKNDESGKAKSKHKLVDHSEEKQKHHFRLPKLRHLSSLFTGTVFQVSDELPAKDVDVQRTLRQMIAHGAELTGLANDDFAALTTTNPPTHILIPSGSKQRSSLISVTLDQVKQHLSTGQPFM
ncbi:unnamed protein product [Dicrocoelium dendriticum]|nr:unnamed protein product [Dicrocoelium dendriticum]